MGLREEKKAELRRQIRTTALRLFGERGFHDTTVADIVALLRISEATFFNYFPSKRAVCEEAVLDLVDAALRSAFEASAPVLDQLRRLVNELATQFAADRPLIDLLRRQPEIMAVAALRIARPHLVLSPGFGAAQERGELRTDVPAETLSESFLTTTLVSLGRALAHGTMTTLDDELGISLTLWVEGSISAA